MLEKKVILFKGEINREISTLEQVQMDIKESKLDQKQQRDLTKNIKQAWPLGSLRLKSRI